MKMDYRPTMYGSYSTTLRRRRESRTASFIMATPILPSPARTDRLARFEQLHGLKIIDISAIRVDTWSRGPEISVKAFRRRCPCTEGGAERFLRSPVARETRSASSPLPASCAEDGFPYRVPTRRRFFRACPPDVPKPFRRPEMVAPHQCAPSDDPGDAVMTWRMSMPRKPRRCKETAREHAG